MNAETEMATADGLGAAAPSTDDVQRMREWIADSGLFYPGSSYAEALELLADAPDWQIIGIIHRHYEGSVAEFLREGAWA